VNVVFEKDFCKAARNASRTLTDGKSIAGVDETEFTWEVRLLTIGCIYPTNVLAGTAKFLSEGLAS